MRSAITVLLLAAAPIAAQELVSFPHEGLTLHGFLYRPAGTGPFPTVLWNHGSEQRPGWQAALAAFYTSHGFVFFLPHRRGHGRSPGEYIVDLQKKVPPKAQVELHDRYNTDVVAALEWLRTQPYVDSRRIVMSGVSYGGIQTLISAGKGLGIRGFLAFAPAAMSWANVDLRERLMYAVKHARAPVFLLQAANDYNTGPSEVLGPEIRKRGPPNQAKLYPAFGKTHLEGHAAFACSEAGIAVWRDDALKFIEAVCSDRAARERRICLRYDARRGSK